MLFSVAKNGGTNARMICMPLLVIIFMIVLSGCLALRPPVEMKYVSGAVVKSLSSNVSLEYTTPDRSISGSGYLMYRKPDQMRVVILSPFGSVIQEIYISGELVTIIDAGNGIAFSGNYLDLPEKGDFSGWRYIHWLIDIDPPESIRGSAVIERINRFGQREKASFENGLLKSKSIAVGGDVRYGRYTTVQGTAIPLEILYETVVKEKFAILLEDPEVNVPFADGVFTPDLNKLRVYPLSSLK